MFFTITHLSREYCHGLLVILLLFLLSWIFVCFHWFPVFLCLGFPPLFSCHRNLSNQHRYSLFCDKYMGNYYYYYQLILFQATQFIRTVLPDTHSNNDKRPGARFNKEVQPTLSLNLNSELSYSEMGNSEFSVTEQLNCVSLLNSK